MAATNLKTTVAGKKLMLFDASGHSFAFATTHTLSINGETSEVSNKDTGLYGSSMVNKITWEITSENVFPLDASGGTEFNDLLTHMTSRDEVTVYFGFKVETGSTYSGSTSGDGLKQGKGNIDADYWEADTSKTLYKGKVIITSLQLNAPNGEESSYQCTMTGIGSLTKVSAIG